MRILKYLAEGMNLLNLILLAVIVLLAGRTVLPFIGGGVQYGLPSVKEAEGKPDEKPAEIKFPSIMEYTMITEKNLFHPDRKAPAADEKGMGRPDIILYGTLVTDEISLAYIEDKNAPKTTDGRGKRQTVLKKGESIGGYVLKRVERDRIVLVKGDQEMVVQLQDPRKTREAAALPTAVEKKPGAPAARPGSASHPAAVRPPATPAPSPARPAAPVTPPRTVPGPVPSRM